MTHTKVMIDEHECLTLEKWKFMQQWNDGNLPASIESWLQILKHSVLVIDHSRTGIRKSGWGSDGKLHNEAYFALDLLALHLENKKDDGITRVEVIQEIKHIGSSNVIRSWVLDLDNPVEFTLVLESIHADLEKDGIGSYLTRDGDYARFLEPIILKSYSTVETNPEKIGTDLAAKFK